MICASATLHIAAAAQKNTIIRSRVILKQKSPHRRGAAYVLKNVAEFEAISRGARRGAPA